MATSGLFWAQQASSGQDRGDNPNPENKISPHFPYDRDRSPGSKQSVLEAACTDSVWI